MRNRSCIDSIVDDYKSAVDLSIYRGGGLDPLPSELRANPAIFTNKRSEKLGTLICSARARTVRTADRPASGPDCPHLNLVLNICPPRLLVELSKPKANNSMRLHRFS
jgi:hypothetical protein